MIKTSCIFDFEMEYLFVNFFCGWNSVTVVFNTSQRKQICNHLLRYRWACSFFQKRLNICLKKTTWHYICFIFDTTNRCKDLKLLKPRKILPLHHVKIVHRSFRPSLYFVCPTPFLRIGSLTFFDFWHEVKIQLT